MSLDPEKLALDKIKRLAQYTPVTCTDVANNLLANEGMGKIGKPSKNVYSSEYGTYTDRSPKMIVKGKSTILSADKAEKESGRAITTEFTDNTSKGAGNTWSLKITDKFEEVASSMNFARAGHYVRSYNFSVINGECVLNGIKVSFSPIDNIYTEVTQLDYKRCLPLSYKYAKNEATKMTVRFFYTEKQDLENLYGPICLQMLSHFKDIRPSDDVEGQFAPAATEK